jgi:hypothetical protein
MIICASKAPTSFSRKSLSGSLFQYKTKRHIKMRQQILNQIINALGQRNTFFIREQDIQLYLAAHFIDSNLFDNVFIEYHA